MKKKTEKELRERFLKEYAKFYGVQSRRTFFQSFLKDAKSSNLISYTTLCQGYIYWLEKKYSNALESFNKSIEADPSLAFPWHGLGNVYYDQKKSEEAINAYQKSLEIDPDFAFPWHGLGNIYYKQKKYEEAINACQKALEIDPNFAFSWYGLGVVYLNQKKYEEAINAYQKVIEINSTFSPSYFNLGLVYIEINKYREAEEQLTKAVDSFEKEKDKYWVSIATMQRNKVKKYLESENVLKNEQTPKDRTERVLRETEEFAEKVLNNKKNFMKFLKEKDRGEVKDAPCFQVLRRWNSYTPIIADNYHLSKGGGYFLNTGLTGLVIDPGFNFIENFKGAGRLFHEIDAVYISHAHNDHTSDLESILTLLHKYNEEIRESEHTPQDTIRAEIAEEKEINYNDVSSDEVMKVFKDSERRKTIDLYITLSVLKKYSGLFDITSKCDYTIHVVEGGDRMDLDGGKTRLTIIEAKHFDILSDRDSTGLLVEINNTAIIYTGDTGWSEKMAKRYGEIAEGIKGKNKLLVAHLGGFKKEEINYVSLEDEKKEESYYKNHLGRIGMVKINETLQPETCFLSEFGEELKGHNRERVVDAFNNAFGELVCFLPADIGLTYDHTSRKVAAYTEVNEEKSTLKVELVEPRDISTVLLKKDHSLHYYQKSKSIDTNDLVQLLGNEYDKSIGNS